MYGPTSIPHTILAAFPWVEDIRLVEHDLERLTGDLVALSPNDFRKYLPVVLLGIWRKGREGSQFSHLDDQVIYTLDGEVIGESDSNARAIRREARRRLFLGLNSDQKEAVYFWLKACQGFPFLEFCKPEYESAVSFWRAQTRDHPDPHL